MSAGPCPYSEGAYTEWLVTGDAGPLFGPYRHVFTDEEAPRRFLDSSTAFVENVKNIRVQQRTVVVEAWTDTAP